MSVTSTMRSSLASQSFPRTPATPGQDNVPFHHQPTYLTLSRMLIRYQHIILLQPLSETLSPLQSKVQAELRSPLPFHRTKWLHNIEYARTLLLQLEHSAQAIKVQRPKRDAIRDLAEKRVIIKKLRHRVEELGREVESLGDEAPVLDEEGDMLEEILGLQTLSDDKEARKDLPLNDKPVTSMSEDKHVLNPETSIDNAGTILDGKPYTNKSSKDELFGSARQRRGAKHPSTKEDTATTSGFTSLPSTEKALHADSRTQETLTTSLVSMAAQLKQQARTFQGSMGLDKGVVDRAVEGLEKNLSGMSAASKNMQFLRRMSEGQGWLGRMKLYAMILGLWVLAILLVFVGPKLRF